MRSMPSPNLPLAAQLADRNWRLLLADQMSEGLKVVKAHGITPSKIQGVSPALFPGCCACQIFFSASLRRKMLAIDPRARSSMWEDLSRGRPTEIDYLQGVIIRLADEKEYCSPAHPQGGCPCEAGRGQASCEAIRSRKSGQHQAEGAGEWSAPSPHIDISRAAIR